MDADHSKGRKHPVWAVLFALVGMVSGMPAGAQDIPAPPYYISRGEYVVIGIAYDESRLKKLAPAGVQMAPGATGVIVMYTASESYCQRVSGMIHEVTPKPGADTIQLIKIPNVGDWCAAESTKVEIKAPASDPFGQLNPVKVLWGGFYYGGFGWSAPVIAR